MFNIQRPPAWLFNALGIISGGAPLMMWHELQATVDVAQGGMGLDAQYKNGRLMNTALAPTFDQPLPAEEVDSLKYCWLFRCAISNNDTVPVDFRTYYTFDGPGIFMIMNQKAVPADTAILWPAIGEGMQYVYVPPGCHLFNTIGAGATIASEINWELIRLPAGVKPW